MGSNAVAALLLEPHRRAYAADSVHRIHSVCGMQTAPAMSLSTRRPAAPSLRTFACILLAMLAVIALVSATAGALSSLGQTAQALGDAIAMGLEAGVS